MSDAVSTIGPKVTSNVPRPAAPSSAASKPAAAAPQPQNQRISPALAFDPIAGVMITQYLGSDGKVQTQLPSTAAIAYLRMGLTTTGEPRVHAKAPSSATPAQNEKNVVA